MRAYIDDLNLGIDGPAGKNFNMRWVASLVAETHRILIRGGIFIYPGDSRKGYERGRLRMLYECAPIDGGKLFLTGWIKAFAMLSNILESQLIAEFIWKSKKYSSLFSYKIIQK